MGSVCTDDVEQGAESCPQPGARSESMIMENIGPYGSSALLPYHGVMVRLRCQLIVRASGRERPENPRVFVRPRHADDVGAMPVPDGLHPPTARILFMSRAAYHRSPPMYQECPQVAVTLLPDAEQACAST